MTTQYTPGPWVLVNPDDGSNVIRSEEGKPIAELWQHNETRGNARLIAAAPELLSAQTMGVEINTPDFLEWIAQRIVFVYGESPNVDFVISLRDRALAGRAAIAKATGAAS